MPYFHLVVPTQLDLTVLCLFSLSISWYLASSAVSLVSVWLPGQVGQW